MIDTLIAAVDGSSHSDRALAFAADLARRYEARLIVLSVYRHHSSLESTHSLVRPRERIEAPDATLGRLAREVADGAAARAREAGVATVEAMVRRGPPARTIVKVAEECRAGAVVMGSRGLGDIEGMLLGSVSHKVSSLAPCTCITVK